jgi:hypothetical protein
MLGSDGAKAYEASYKSTHAGADPTAVERPDSRGNTTITTGFLFAAGKTFRSGKLNLPVNIFFMPSTHGMRYGISVGWNGKDRNTLRQD